MGAAPYGPGIALIAPINPIGDQKLNEGEIREARNERNTI